MSVEKLRRVIWRLKEKKKTRFTQTEMERAVMLEIGTDERTVAHNLKNIKKLGMAKRINRCTWEINNNDTY